MAVAATCPSQRVRRHHRTQPQLLATCDKNIVTHWDFPCHPSSMLVTGGIVCYLHNINRFLPTLRRGKGGRNAAVDILPVSQRFLSGVVCTVMQQVNPINFQAINAMSSRQLHIPVEFYNLRHDYCATVKTLVKCTYSFGTYNDISLFLNTRKGLVCSDVYLYTYICHSNLIDE